MSRLEGKKILIVEDDKFLSEMLAGKLLAEKALVARAPDGESAIEMASLNRYDLILLDILLPKKDGYTVLKELKADEKAKEIDVIILSNLGQKADVDMGVKLGAKKFLVKALLSIDEIVEGVVEDLK
ncbi:MAG: response regulator [Candidatus Paceibacterota bacterium]|jgi:DNA-binding response OmpR family regulator